MKKISSSYQVAIYMAYMVFYGLIHTLDKGLQECLNLLDHAVCNAAALAQRRARLHNPNDFYNLRRRLSSLGF
jgi:hypothetical protein